MERIAIVGHNSVEYIDKILSIWNDEKCAVLLDHQIPIKKLIDILVKTQAQKCFFEKGIFNSEEVKEISRFVEFEEYFSQYNLTGELPICIYEKFTERYTNNEAIIIYSSGTTGEAKGIILSHYAINSNADSIIDYMKVESDDCMYIVKSLTHSSTLVGELLVALKTKTKVIIAPVVVPPRVVLKNIERFNVTILCANPTLLLNYADEQKAKKYNLKSLKKIYVSGSILSDKIYVFANQIFENVQIFNVYGLSEAGPRVTAQRSNISNTVGTPIKNVRIVIVNDNGDEVKDGQHGVVYVNTPSKFSGYVTKNEKFFSLYKNWINTGDIGFIDNNGELNIVGRIDDVMIVDSHKIYPMDIEREILNHSTIYECVVTNVEFNSKNIIACLYVGDKIENDIRYKLMDSLLSYEIPRIFIHIDSIPKTNTGKVMYDKCKMIILDEIRRREKYV